jgi:hypothetical protein
MPDIPITPEEMRDYPGKDLPPENSKLEFPACLRGRWTMRVDMGCGQEQSEDITEFLNEAHR